MTGLSVSDVVSVSVTLSPVAVSTRNFGAAAIIGPSAILSSSENLRSYASLTGLGNDFGLTTPEYLAAKDLFSASPTPSIVYVGQQRTGESLAASIQRLTAASGDWYCALPANTTLADSDILAAAQVIEAASPARIMGVTTQEPGAIVAGTTTDLASVLMAATLTRTFVQYSSANAYAAAGIFGRFATVDWSGGTNVAPTAKFQTEPGVAYDSLTETQYAALAAKRCNAYVLYQNGAAIVQEGVMSSSYYIDERIGLDWLQNALQVAGFNTLYGASTKIPQTDAGMNVLGTAYAQIFEQAITNGLGAPGVWTGPAFGSLSTGQTLSAGYYIYMAPVSSQSAADRAARKATTCTSALKLAGAVHSSNVLVNVVR